MIFELIAGYAALRVIQDSHKKQEDADCLSDFYWEQKDKDEKYCEEIRNFNSKEAREEKARKDREWEISVYGSPFKRDKKGRVIKVNGGLLLENGEITYNI